MFPVVKDGEVGGKLTNNGERSSEFFEVGRLELFFDLFTNINSFLFRIFIYIGKQYK